VADPGRGAVLTMRIIHTADWHLCTQLGLIDRTADLMARVESVARYCEDYAADVLLIAGDLFAKTASVDQMADALRHINTRFASFFTRGGTILAITGNHDLDDRIDLVRSGMALAAPAPASGRLTPGRMYLQNGLGFASLEGKSGDRVQFVLMPYPTKSRYIDVTDRYYTKEEVNRLLQARATDWLSRLPNESLFEPSLPTVLAAHFHITGAEINSRYDISEREDIDFSPGSLPTAWAYVALGHIHKAQTLGGMPHVRYSGPLDRLKFDEREYECGVLLAEVGRSGLVGEPEWLPLAPTPFHAIDLTDPDATLPGLADAYPDRDRAIVSVRAKPSERFGRDDITREVRRLFPRLHALTWADAEMLGGSDPGPAAGYSPRADLGETVRHYIDSHASTDEKAELLALAETFLATEGAP
jgi:DNA repair protein SbcD/Mre11